MELYILNINYNSYSCIENDGQTLPVSGQSTPSGARVANHRPPGTVRSFRNFRMFRPCHNVSSMTTVGCSAVGYTT